MVIVVKVNPQDSCFVFITKNKNQSQSRLAKIALHKMILESLQLTKQESLYFIQNKCKQEQKSIFEFTFSRAFDILESYTAAHWVPLSYFT